MPNLTPKQARFVDEHLIDLNATQAEIRAGYSKKAASFIGAENLTKPNIAKAIQAAKYARPSAPSLPPTQVALQPTGCGQMHRHRLLEGAGIVASRLALGEKA